MRIDSPEATCDGKRAYTSPALAADAIKRIGKRNVEAPRLKAYRCKHCSNWHLTSQKPMPVARGRPQPGDEDIWT